LAGAIAVQLGAIRNVQQEIFNMKAIIVICLCVAFSATTFAGNPPTVGSLLKEGYDIVGTLGEQILLKKASSLYVCNIQANKKLRPVTVICSELAD
jgi:hypothetical protein